MSRSFSTPQIAGASRRAGALSIAALLLGGCTVGPKYVRPAADVPADYKESANFKTAQPSDASAKGKWWEVYGDPQLDALEEQVSVSNQSLKAAQAQFVGGARRDSHRSRGIFPHCHGGRFRFWKSPIAKSGARWKYHARNLRRLSVAAD